MTGWTMLKWIAVLCTIPLWLVACEAESPGLPRSTSTFIFITPTSIGPNATAVLSPTPTLSTSTAEPVNCLEELVQPQLTETQPNQVTPGDEIKVIGRGGYVQDRCGGYNESARIFQLYFNDQLLGSLGCYVNHCEGRFIIPAETQPGMHCISTEVGQCGLEIQVATP